MDTSHEFLDKGAEGLLKNSEAGCGQMLGSLSGVWWLGRFVGENHTVVRL